jgi:SAM-dependent methyltransferase
MADFKDLFSPQAADYARFRPSYPDALFDWLATQAPGRALAVDLGCGNGQASAALARRFAQVVGVEPSQAQLDNAVSVANVHYVCAAAEATGLPDGQADLISVAQAFHWFKRPAVFDEMQRLLKPGGAVALWCYVGNQVSPDVDAVVDRLYHTHLDPYWDPARRLVETGYRDVEFPAQWKEIAAPAFSMRNDWDLQQLLGYLGTWSPLKRFREARGFDALEEIRPDLEKAWGSAATRSVDWPLGGRFFRVE